MESSPPGPSRSTTTAHADQVAAAARHARAIIDGAVHGDRVDLPIGPFVTTFMAELKKADKRGRLRRCRHLAGRVPAPLWVLACRPSRVYCARCARDVLETIVGTVEDATCDVCRQAQPGAMIWSTVGAIGPVLLSFGACTPCRDLELGQVRP